MDQLKAETHEIHELVASVSRRLDQVEHTMVICGDRVVALEIEVKTDLRKINDTLTHIQALLAKAGEK